MFKSVDSFIDDNNFDLECAVYIPKFHKELSDICNYPICNNGHKRDIIFFYLYEKACGRIDIDSRYFLGMQSVINIGKLFLNSNELYNENDLNAVVIIISELYAIEINARIFSQKESIFSKKFIRKYLWL